MKQILINGQSLDIIDEEPIALTLQVNNIAELKDRQASFSNTIKIPLTAKNKIILGNPDVAGSNSVKPYRLPHTTFIQNGIIVLPSAVSYLDQTEGNFVNLILFSGILDFFNIIKEKKLSDLDLSDLDHVWDAQTAVNLNANGGTVNNCIYPLIQTGTVSEIDNPYDLYFNNGKYYNDGGFAQKSETFGIQFQTPSVYFKLIVDRIFLEAGYEKSGLIFTDSLYNIMAVHANRPLELTKKFIDDRSSIVGTTEVIYKSISGFGENGNWGPFVFPFNNEQLITYYNNRLITGTVKTGYKDGDLDCFNNLQYKYVAKGSYTISIEVVIPVNMNMKTGRSELKIILYKNGSEVSNKPLNTGATAGNVTEDFQIIRLDTFKDVCNLGDEYWVTFEVNDLINGLATYDLTVPHFTNGNLTAENCYFKITVLSEINIGMKLPIAQLLPDMTQSEFIKAWAQMFGIIFQADTLTNTMQCVQFKEIPKSEVIDWSKKLDLNKRIDVKFRFDDYGQTNNLKYAKEEEGEKEGIGNDSFLINDETLEKTKDVIELPFQASGPATIFSDILTVNVPIYVAKTGIPITYDKKDVGPRIFAIKKKAHTIIYTDGLNDEILTFEEVVHPVAYFDEVGQERSLSFESDLKPNNYTELIEALNKCKIIRASFYLTEMDIQNLDFFKQIYVEYFNLMFYVNVVEQYVEGRSTLVELVKI